MRRVFIDTNILLDLLLERQPWVHQASGFVQHGRPQRVRPVVLLAVVFHRHLFDESSKIHAKRNNHQISHCQITLYGYNC